MAVKVGGFIKVSENSDQSIFIELSNRIKIKEVALTYYAIDGNTGYFYYKVLK